MAKQHLLNPVQVAQLDEKLWHDLSLVDLQCKSCRQGHTYFAGTVLPDKCPDCGYTKKPWSRWRRLMAFVKREVCRW